MSTFRYIWDNLSFPIVLPPLEQGEDTCGIAATARQLEYQLRLAYAQADPPIQLRADPIFLHFKWEKLLKEMTTRQSRWSPWKLLLMALDEGVRNTTGEPRSGVPLWNKLTHWIDERKFLDQNEFIPKISQLFDSRIPVVVVIQVNVNYPHYAEHPYTGLDDNGGVADAMLRNKTDQYGIVTEVQETHAVVLVGDYKAKEGNPYGLAPDTYWLYQNSTKGKPLVPSLLPNGIGILHPRVVIEAYYGVSHPTNVVLPISEAPRRVINQKSALIQRRVEREAYQEAQARRQRSRR